MTKDRIGKLIYVIAIVILLIVIIWLVLGMLEKKEVAVTDDGTSVVIPHDDVTKLYEDRNIEPVEEIVTIDTEVISDGLREMGTLVTEEYFFTQVERRTSTKKWTVFTSEATLAFSYDGTVTAGIDCNEIDVSKDEENRTITISIPKADIINVDIDHESFKKLEEKNGLWNKIDMTTFNESIIDFENAAKKKATEKGVIEKADESAKRMIESFVNSLIDSSEYKVVFEIKK